VLVLATALTASACSEADSQLVVVVDTDLRPRSELVCVRVAVSAPGQPPTPEQTADYFVTDDPGANDGREPMPFSFGVRPRGGDATRRVRIEVSGYLERECAGEGDIAAVRETGFLEGRSLLLPVFLSTLCAGVRCEGAESCQAGVCQSVERSPGDLGTVEPGQEIDLGDDPPDPDFRELVPSNVGGEVALDASDAVVTVGAEGHPIWVVHTDDGRIEGYHSDVFEDVEPTLLRPPGRIHEGGIGFTPIAQAATPAGLAVFSLGRLEVPADTMLIGVGSRPLVFLAASEIRVVGTVSVAANALSDGRPGAGGYRGGQVQAQAGFGPGGGRGGGVVPDPDGGDPDVGGGDGGSYGSAGGRGGAPRVEASPSGPYGGTLIPLLGGSGGGAGASVSSVVAFGGAGGGALQLSAGRRIVVEAGGMVDASGAGGAGNRGAFETGGGGGGAGGAILMEAAVVQVAGFLGANGGAGGNGVSRGRSGESGADGRADRVPAPAPPGGLGVQAGGDGSDETGDVGDGESGGTGGGGGGGAGRIRIRTATGRADVSGLVFPSLASGLATVDRADSAP
jgi:hypothetical protein